MRLNNSGYGAPPQTFRCPEIGRCHNLDLLAALAAWPDLAAGDLAALEEAVQRGNTPLDRAMLVPARIPAATAASIVGGLLQSLGAPGEPVREESAMEAATLLLGRLVRHVVGLGWHRTLLGLGSPLPLSPATWRVGEPPAGPLQPSESVALTVAAFAVFRPPLLLWTRAPSLDWLRVDMRIAIRQLWQGRSAA